MKVLMLVEIEDPQDLPSVFDAEVFRRKMLGRLHDDIRGGLEYAAEFSLVRLDVAGVDGVTTESIISDVFHSGVPPR